MQTSEIVKILDTQALVIGDLDGSQMTFKERILLLLGRKVKAVKLDIYVRVGEFFREQVADSFAVFIKPNQRGSDQS